MLWNILNFLYIFILCLPKGSRCTFCLCFVSISSSPITLSPLHHPPPPLPITHFLSLKPSSPKLWNRSQHTVVMLFLHFRKRVSFSFCYQGYMNHVLWCHTIYWAFCWHFVFRGHVIVHCLCVQPVSVGARATWLSHMTNIIGSKYANSSWRHIIPSKKSYAIVHKCDSMATVMFWVQTERWNLW